MNITERHVENAVTSIKQAIESTDREGVKCFLNFVLNKMVDYQDTVGRYFDETRQTREF